MARRGAGVQHDRIRTDRADRADRAAWRLILCAAILVPLAFAPWLADIFSLPKLVILGALGTTAAGLTAIAGVHRGIRLPRRPTIALAGLCVIATLATLLSRAPRLSLVGVYQRYGGLLPLLIYVAVGATVWVLAAGNATRVAWLLGAMGVGAAVAATYETLQHLGIDAFEFREASGAATRFPGSTMGNSNFAGGLFAIAIPILLAGLVVMRGRHRWGAAALLAIDISGLWWSQSRGAMVAAAAGTATLGLILTRGRAKVPRALAIGAALVALGAVVFATAAIVTPTTGRLPGPLRELEILRSESARQRQDEWRAALGAIAERPVLGHGPDTYVLAYPQHRTRMIGSETGLLLADKPHNVALEWFVSTGVLGGLVYLGIAVSTLLAGRRALRTLAPSTRVVLAAAIAAFVAYAVQACFSIDVVALALFGWMLLGTIAALSIPLVTTPAPASSRGPRRTRVGTATAWLAAITVVAVATVGVIAIAANRHVEAGEGAEAAGRWDAASRSYESAIGLAPEEAAYHRAAGLAAEQSALATDDRIIKKRELSRAVDHLAEALDRQPGNVVFLVDLARVHLARAQQIDPRGYAESDRYWTMAVERDRHDWELRELHALALNEWANAGGESEVRERAGDEFAVVVDLRPDYYYGWINLGRVHVALGDLTAARQAAQRAFALVPFGPEALDLVEAIDAAER